MSRYPRWMRLEQQSRDLAKVAAIVNAGNDEQPEARTRRTRNTAADARVLRMIPVHAEGVPGTAPGTDPYHEAEQALLRSGR